MHPWYILATAYHMYADFCNTASFSKVPKTNSQHKHTHTHNHTEFANSRSFFFDAFAFYFYSQQPQKNQLPHIALLTDTH